ncbi:MAG: NHL repeat-containing protein [Lachnospiraceae bacterium]|nr:NHL repeat-containing protein [Lachnospiraceae bacterium]
MAAACVIGVMLNPVQAEASMEHRSYTYIYDYWEDVQDCPNIYDVSRVYTSSDLGLDTRMNTPSGLFVKDNTVYVCDTGNNRIIVLEKGETGLSLVKIIDSVKYAPGTSTFSGPTDVAVSDDGNIFIADKGNNRILKCDSNMNYLMEFTVPIDSALPSDVTFQPNKLVVDTAERVYCIADGINKGLIKYEPDGTFSGFIGATKAAYNWTDYIWKRFASQEQLDRMMADVPTEYSNIFMDYEGFIYASAGSFDPDDLDAGTVDAIRRLNLLGNDILVRNGDIPVYGDLYWGSAGGYVGPSYFSDVTAFENDVYVCLDRNRGRLFGYNDQGRMVFAFGGNGNMDGYFRRPVAIDHIGYDLLVLDTIDCSITYFTLSDFGKDIYSAIDMFDAGEYEASGEAWQRVLNVDGNYDLAYIGIGRSLLRQEQYKEAMRYFEIKYDDENYSKAFKEYRKEWVQSHLFLTVFVLLLLLLIPLSIDKYKDMQVEIATSDVFRFPDPEDNMTRAEIKEYHKKLRQEAREREKAKKHARKGNRF